MGKISIQEVAKILIDKYGLTAAEAENFVASIFEVVQNGLDSDKQVKIKGLGTFKIIGVEARESVNVNTGERVLIDSHGKITFTPDATMKELVNKPFSQFDTVILGEEIELEPQKPVNAEPDSEKEEGGTSDVYEEANGVYVSEESACITDVEEDLKATSKEVVSAPDVENIQSDSKDPVEESMHEVNMDNSAGIHAVIEHEPLTESDEDEDSSDNGNHWLLNILFIIIVLIIAGLAAYFGYSYGRYEASKKETREINSCIENQRIVVENTAKQDSVSLESVKDTMTTVIRDTIKVESVNTNVSETEDFSKYEEMDNRVRTGAYRIVGTDHTLTVRAGETLTGIARRTLGDGMTCYIEVYNGLQQNAHIKEGQKLKIPKLELKKKRKK